MLAPQARTSRELALTAIQASQAMAFVSWSIRGRPLNLLPPSNIPCIEAIVATTLCGLS
jgi:hypothetical protein